MDKIERMNWGAVVVDLAILAFVAYTGFYPALFLVLLTGGYTLRAHDRST